MEVIKKGKTFERGKIFIYKTNISVTNIFQIFIN